MYLLRFFDFTTQGLIPLTILDKEKKLKTLEKELKHLEDDKAQASILKTIDEIKKHAMKNLDAWDRVLLARHPKRPKFQDIVSLLFDNFIELHGDRLFGDDSAVSGGIAFFNGRAVTVIGHVKGKSTDENIHHNFGMAHPEGYRKSLRLMQQAEKFGRPIITFIDTPGAYPGVGAEERGQSEAISRSLYEMSHLSVPVIAFVVGEGGSGGALAIGVANKVYMLENSIYSILSPEGYASILWKDASKQKEAAEAMKLTAFDLRDFGIVDGIVKEPLFGAHRDKKSTIENMRETLTQALETFEGMNAFEIRNERYLKFRNTGFFQRFNYENLKGVY